MRNAPAALLTCCLFVPLGAGSLGAAPQNATELAALQDQAVERLVEYIGVDTINPPGNESRGVEFFARIFDDAGIAYETVEPEPGRGSIWATLEGGEEPALVLLHHIDVVPADMEHWIVDPLSGEIRDGFVWGRGALDTKALGIQHLQAFLALHASGRPLARDVIFMATADEEAGGFVGAGWLAENRPELFADVGMILNEGGRAGVLGEEPADTADIAADTTIAFNVEVTQKVPWWLLVTAGDEPGHGSRPRVTSSVTRLIQALARIDNYQFEPRMVPAVDDYFKAIAEDAEPRWAARFADMPAAIRDPAFLLELQLYDPALHALTRNTCSITMLEGSGKINVVPPSAAAQLDCRLLPDQDPQAFIEQLSVIINDPAIDIEVMMGFTPAVSTTDTDLYRAIETVTRNHFPASKVVPSVAGGFTDSHFFRDMDIVSYGFAPMVLTPNEANRIHGNNERISVQNVRDGVQIVLEILQAVVYE